MDNKRMTTDGAADGTSGTTRRGLLKCMAYAGAGVLWTVSGGVPKALYLGGEAVAATGDFSFVQISDTHIGFKNDINPDPVSTLHDALEHIGKMPSRPAMMLHTGDVSHLAKPEQFDTAAEILKTAGLDIHYVPGEHDVLNDDGKSFFERFVPESKTGGWYSFDQGGVHFVALVNVLNLKAGGLGYLGAEQLAWLDNDLRSRSASTPVVVLAHMPMWPLFPQWGWGTDDAAQALSSLKRFGSVTVLNGHIHQVMQKVEGTVSFHTARSTAFPQPAPGEGTGPGPLKVPAERLKSVLGIRRVEVARQSGTVTISDATLDA